jgi:4-hydroxybenzoate polyprenyltransferase
VVWFSVELSDGRRELMRIERRQSVKIFWYIVKSMRPWQWTKNFVLFAGVVFSRRFHDLDLVERSFLGFVVFCLLSGAVYLMNDVLDRKRDREHPDKKWRPISMGLLHPATALTAAIILVGVLLPLSWFLGRTFFLLTILFVLLNVIYSAFLKRAVILDGFAISFSFLIRAAAGVVVLHPIIPGLELSPWLLICTLFLSLFLAFCKRRYEICALQSAGEHRSALREYTPMLLDQLVGLSAAATLLSYSIYTVWPNTVEKFSTTNLVFTVPFVGFGLMRYLYLVYSRNEGGDPSGVLLLDRTILVDVFLWFIAVMFILWKA